MTDTVDSSRPPASDSRASALEHVVETKAGTLRVRRATPEDEPGLRRLFSSIMMDADLSLQICRDPDFFALYRMQSSDWETWVGELGGELVGLGTLLVRDGYLGGVPRRVGYLGDLRIDPRVRGREVLATLYGPVLDGFAERHGVDVFLTAVIASNRRAMAALTGPGAAQLGIPTYHLLERFQIRALQTIAARPPSRAHRRRWRARTATDADLPSIAAFLDQDARARAFGIPMDVERLRAHLVSWEGLDIGDFHLVEDSLDGSLAGVLAVWDATPAKQTIVTAYRGSMRWIRRGHGVMARPLRAARLPAPGAVLHYAYATHHAVLEDPAAQRVLLHHAWRAIRSGGRGDLFLSCRVPDADASSSAYRGFVSSDLPANVYAVVPGGRELPAELRDARSVGFEMALV